MQCTSHYCKICKMQINHQIRVVSDLLPAYVHVVECTGCGELDIKSMEPA